METTLPTQDEARTRVGWVVASVTILIFLVVAGLIIYGLAARQRVPPDDRHGGLLPVEPVTPSAPLQPITPALPIDPQPSRQVRLPDGKYRIRWGRTGPYVGATPASQGTDARAILVDPPSAVVWTFTSTDASYVGGGQWTTPASVGLSTDGAWLLPTPILVQGAGVPLTALRAWRPTQGIAADGSIHGGALHNLAYSGCVRPTMSGMIGDGLSLYGDCDRNALGWFFEPAS
ncbi:hypothetical protein pkur_cds_365 [Pandoravirus kuranda]|uniref:Uncharacterized protein n=1 Tax=Pandoravirus kuranda TaxID=3019033 RepID=A0AA95ED10_9VIRU|nr:hypothetical protein pkur_cds_365 [Pandoravirus kuranda]